MTAVGGIHQVNTDMEPATPAKPRHEPVRYHLERVTLFPADTSLPD